MNPKQFGRYEIQAEVGRGGMAVVYRALDPQLGRTVALKVLPAQFMHDPSFLDRFQREAHTIAQLEHYAIVPLYDYGEHEGQPFLVMRYMSGGTLADRLRDGPLSVHQSLQIMDPICAALDKAHLNGIVHRDLKPGNILFDDEASAYLSDFGIVRLSGQTHTHTVIGTPQYMAPEQAHGHPVDSRTDVYQMGVVLFNMLVGPVFSADRITSERERETLALIQSGASNKSMAAQLFLSERGVEISKHCSGMAALTSATPMRRSSRTSLHGPPG